MAKPQPQAADNGGYVPTKIPGVLRLGNKYSRDPNYPPQAAPPSQQARQSYTPILKPVTATSPRPQKGLEAGYNPFTKQNTPGTLPEEDVQLAEDAKRPRKLAKGGLVKGQGTATSDSIPAKLSKGEVVIPAKVVKHFGLGTFKKMIAAVPPQKGAKTEVKDGVVHAAASIYIDPKKPVNLNYIKDDNKGSLLYQGAKTAADALIGQQGQANVGQAVENVGQGINNATQTGVKAVGQQVQNVADVGTRLAQDYDPKGYGALGSVKGFFNRAGSQLADLLPNSTPAITPTTQPQRQATSVNKPAIPETQAGPDGNNGNNGNTAQTGQPAQTGALGNNRIDLGNGNYIGDGKARSPESIARMQGIMAKGQLGAEDSQLTPEQRRAKQVQIVDDRYAWAKNREAERQQEAQQANLNAQIQQAQAVLMSPDLGGKKEAMALLDYAGRLQGQQSQNQQQANQFGQNMAWNREQSAALGATEANKLKQQKDIEQAKLDANKFATRGGGIDPNTGQVAPGIVYSTKTGLDVGKNDQEQPDITPEEYAHPLIMSSAKAAYDYAMAHPKEAINPRIKALVKAYLDNNQVKKS